MKPFDLEKAQAGEPVITRDGRPVVFGRYNPNAISPYATVVGWVGGTIYAWSENGRHLSDKYDSSLDLFMAPQKRKGWINLYRFFSGEIITPVIYPSEEDAKVHKGIPHAPIATIPIEWEE